MLWFHIRFCKLSSDDWAISSNPLDLHNARLLAIAALEHQVPETEHEDYVNAGTGGTSLWHSVGLIVSLFNLLLKFNSMVFRCFIRHENSKFFYFFFPIIHGTTPPFLIVVLQIYLCICGTYPCIFVGCMVAIFIFLWLLFWDVVSDAVLLCLLLILLWKEVPVLVKSHVLNHFHGTFP